MIIGHPVPGVNYTNRTAVRAILQDSETEDIAIIHVNRGNYYKLPGGGIDPDEDHLVALSRELMEETGCRATLDPTSCFAKVEEYRNDLHQLSYCYIAILVEDTGRRRLTDLETAEGLSHSWVSVSEAIDLMKNATPTSELGRFIKHRDLYLVERFAGRTKVEGGLDDGIDRKDFMSGMTWEEYLRKSHFVPGHGAGSI